MSATAFKTYPPPVMEVSEEGDELLEVAMGPHHPSTHGVFRRSPKRPAISPPCRIPIASTTSAL